MDHAQLLLIRLWEPFNVFLLFLYSSAATVFAGLLGLILAIWLQRRGWLGRRNSWHHYLLKLYFLLLPLAGGFLGFQAGSLYGSQQQIYRHMDSYAPLVQEAADSVRQGLQAYLAEQDLAALEEELKHETVQQALGRLALDYLREEREADAEQLAEASWAERISLTLFDRLRASIVGQMVGERLVEQAAHYTHLDKQVLSQALDARFEQLFDADFLLGLFRQQIGRIFKPFYTALLVQLGGVMALLVAELLLARRLRLLRAPAALAESAASV